ncbi:MAG: GDSL-type esterase/lipase family protein [Tannerella sp.]|nr:GDSL-type esterase/lipase family protein [Tannerella sp.]
MNNSLSKHIRRMTLFLALTTIAAATYHKSYAAIKENEKTIQDDVIVNLPFITDSLCIIKDSAHSLNGFYENLRLLLAGKDTIINIIHIGDSHIQAGFLTGRTMRLLQNTFGNAGRGWISPLRLSGTNEPNDYFITSGIKHFISSVCIQKEPKCTWGLGGIGIEALDAEIDLGVLVAPNNGVGYDFNKALLFRDKYSKQLFPKPDIDCFQGETQFEDILIDTFISNNLINSLQIKSFETDTFLDPSIYYGFLLTNGHAGILYHALGINGARYVDFTNRKYIRQLSLLNPTLIIVSLGTNESFGKNFSMPEFERQIDSFVNLVHEELPNTSIILTTPPETFKRLRSKQKRYYVRNENTKKAAETISSYTAINGLACWDLYAVSGGSNSCNNWFEAGMFARDRIHFTQKGYDEQGKLLYKSLINSFNKVQELREEEQDAE